MREIAPGIIHWTTVHPTIGIEVSSYWLPGQGAVLDPLLPPLGIGAFAERPPAEVVINSAHHYRDAGAFGAPVRCHSAGLHAFGPDRPVQPFAWGDVLAGGLRALEVGVLCPEETAIHVPGVGALALADAVVDFGEGLAFVPDDMLGDDPRAIKAGLLDALERLLEEDFAHLLLAHGDPIAGTGKEALARFVKDGRDRC